MGDKEGVAIKRGDEKLKKRKPEQIGVSKEQGGTRKEKGKTILIKEPPCSTHGAS